MQGKNDAQSPKTRRDALSGAKTGTAAVGFLL
jgi:hypothetical protein